MIYRPLHVNRYSVVTSPCCDRRPLLGALTNSDNNASPNAKLKGYPLEPKFLILYSSFPTTEWLGDTNLIWTKLLLALNS